MSVCGECKALRGYAHANVCLCVTQYSTRLRYGKERLYTVTLIHISIHYMKLTLNPSRAEAHGMYSSSLAKYSVKLRAV
jgi:hypothetical protein